MSTLKARVWLLFDDSSSSVAAFAMSMFIMGAIVLSTISFMLETMPTMEVYPVWALLEVFFVTVFTIEYVMRFWSTPQPKGKFVSEAFNVVDLLAILPFYLELVLSTGGVDLRVLRTVRLVRVVRVFKLGKYSATLQVIYDTILKSTEALAMLLFCLFVLLTLFGAAMVHVERGEWDPTKKCYVRDGESSCSPFESIPQSFYWGITTLTTVGYGDVLPTTVAGKMISNAAMICGVLVIALPVTLIGGAFAEVFESHKNMAAAKRVLGLSVEERKVLHDDCARRTRELRKNVANLYPRVREHLITAAVVCGRFASEDEAGTHITRSLGPLQEQLNRDFSRLVEYAEAHT